MPATNYTPIQLYRSTTSGNLPLAANLSPGELALNIADNDMTMYFENASGVVKRFFNNPAELKYPTADGTSGQFLTTNGAGVLSFGSVTAGALTNNTRQAVTSSATTTINLNSGNVIDLTMAANITTLSFTNVPASGTPILIQIVVKNASDGTAYTIVWPNSVYWSGQYAAATFSTVQTAPTLATGANGVTVIALLTTDGGTKWRGWVEATLPGGLGSSGSLYTWGSAGFGQLGQNSTTNKSSPTQVGALVNWASIAGGSNHFVALKTDGTLWSWGYNVFGNLGHNNNIYASSPIQIGALTNWSSCAASFRNQSAINSSGQLFTWGTNLFGGNGNNLYTGNVSSPIQIGAGQTWAKVARRGFSAFAITTTGQLWSWGNNGSGRLGLNNTVDASSPKQVGALTNWSNLAPGEFSCMALKTDGTIWVWGNNFYGQLGQNNVTYRSSPVQVGSLSTWADIGSMRASFFAISTTGALWAWGRNNYGQLAQNNVTYRSSPVQVGALTNWSRVNKGASDAMAAITTGNALFVWGAGLNGVLGLGNTTYTSSPVQLGSLTTWVFTSIAGNGTVATTAAISGTAVSPA